MTCDQAIEILPWLLNGTLEAQEREEVRQHLRTCERCREALRGTQEAWRLFDEHIPTEALVALAWGQDPAGLDRTTAELHLASCPQCAAEMELVRTSRQLEQDDRIAVFPGRPAVKRSNEGEFRTWRAAALAAGLAGVVAAAGWFNTSQEARLLNAQLAERRVEAPTAQPPARSAPPSAPQADDERIAAMRAQMEKMALEQEKLQQQVQKAQGQLASSRELGSAPILGPILSPSEFGTVRSGGEGGGEEYAEVLRIPAYASSLILPLRAEGSVRGEREIEILNESGHVVWEGRRRRDEDNRFVLQLPAGLLEKGSYSIQILDSQGKPETVYKIRLD